MPRSLLLIAALAFSHFLSASAYSKQTCFQRFAIDKGTAWCRNPAGVPYKCIVGSCHVGIEFTLSKVLRWENCSLNHANELTRVHYVWPTDFTVSNDGKSATVTAGQKAPDLISTRVNIPSDDTIKCTWGNSNHEPNRVRPDCDHCDPAWNQ
ncbi:hypothetical protein O181_052058 [Austropuccinia psidii MF-1]|uniref:Secreted protein n=1 Tax=Austropuccinia psidii MF-1 TaxID=1389203 RepID=A0A9Q3E1Y4_9BASI|nr:hypothetical protein [Austropuccinia psidii MF-1]